MTSLDDIARTFESATTTAVLAGRTLLGLDTNPIPNEWNHITKIDPEDEKRLPLLYPLYLQHTGAVEVGGSRDVTSENTEETLELVANRPRPAIQEPSGVRQVTDRTREQADYFAVPQVLNGDGEAIVGTLGAGIEYLREELGPQALSEKLPIPLGGGLEDRLVSFFSAYTLDTAVFEAYIIMNLDSAAAREGNVTEDDLLTPKEAKQYALTGEVHFESEIIYLEYSGTFGGEEAVDILEAMSDSLSWSRIWYGGGLDNRENAEAVLDAGADSVVVGNIFHEVAEEEAALCEQALSDLDADADRDDVEAWLTSTVDIESTDAASYLSTIVDVPNPEARATEYLVTTLQLRLALEPILDDLDDDRPSSLTDIRSTLRDATVPGTTDVENVLGEDVLTEVLTGLLADRYDCDEDTLPVEHVALEL